MLWRCLGIETVANKKPIAVFFIPAFFLLSTNALAYRFNEIQIRGLSATDKSWFDDFINLHPPLEWGEEDLVQLKHKILSTRIFSYATVTPKSQPDDPKNSILTIELEEKWTLIPVIRAQSGGGTPLWVLGGYETNLLGKFITAGAEFRKYGRAPIGYLIYSKSQEAEKNAYFMGFEARSSFRQRTFQVIPTDPVGSNSFVMGLDSVGENDRDFVVKDEQQRVKILFPQSSIQSIRLGLDLRNQFMSTYDQPGFADHRLLFAGSMESESLRVDNILMDGYRWEHSLGLLKAPNSTYPHIEARVFWYQNLPRDLNLGIHASFRATNDQAFISKKFLGGFDSIRGIADGELRGSKTAYMNTELSFLSHRKHYFWMQEVVFLDYGTADDEFTNLNAHQRLSYGAGLRLAIPQIYRMVLRIDYAVSQFPQFSHGLSIGLNQFFQPFRPNLSE